MKSVEVSDRLAWNLKKDGAAVIGLSYINEIIAQGLLVGGNQLISRVRYLPNPLDSENSLLPWHTRAYLLSDYYWDAASTLLEKYTSCSPQQNVATLLPSYYLFTHSIELFLKASLSFSSGTFDWTHEVSKLYTDFLEQNPNEKIPPDVHDFLRTYPARDPKNENCRYPHKWGVILDSRDAGKIFRSIKDYMEGFRKRITDTKP